MRTEQPASDVVKLSADFGTPSRLRSELVAMLAQPSLLADARYDRDARAQLEAGRLELDDVEEQMAAMQAELGEAAA